MIRILDNLYRPVAVLEDYFDDAITEQINGAYELTFSTVIDPDKSPYIAIGNYAEVDSQLFNITTHRRTRSNDGRVTVFALCEQVSYDLLLTEFEGGFVQSGTPADLLTLALDGTGFMVGTVEMTDIITVELREGVTARAVVLEIAAQAGAELLFDRRTIDLLSRRGQVRGVIFALGKNLRGIVKDVDSRSGDVRTAYEIDLLELDTLPEFAGLEYFELGDTVRIRDDELEIDEQQRIIQYTYSPRRKINSKVNIAAGIDGIQNEIYRMQKTMVPKDKYLYGTRIGPDVGLESVRSDKKARLIANADAIKMQKGNGAGSWVDVIVLDADGNAVFTGKVEASQIVGGTVDGTAISGALITGSIIQTRIPGSYPRLEINSTLNNLLAQSSATKLIQFEFGFFDTPMLQFVNGSNAGGFGMLGGSMLCNVPDYFVYLNWSKLYNSSASRTLQDELNTIYSILGNHETRISALE